MFLQAFGLNVRLDFLCLPLQTSDTVLVDDLWKVVWQVSGLDSKRGKAIIYFIKIVYETKTAQAEIPTFAASIKNAKYNFSMINNLI